MKECSIQEHCVGAGALSGVHLSSKINVRETGSCNLFTLVGVFSCLCDFICVCDAIKCVVIVNVILFCCGVCRFSSGWWRMVVLHERVRKMEAGMFSSMCIDKFSVDDFVCDGCWNVRVDCADACEKSSGEGAARENEIVVLGHGQAVDVDHS
jgi:hypothetical protein